MEALAIAIYLLSLSSEYRSLNIDNLSLESESP